MPTAQSVLQVPTDPSRTTGTAGRRPRRPWRGVAGAVVLVVMGGAAGLGLWSARARAGAPFRPPVGGVSVGGVSVGGVHLGSPPVAEEPSGTGDVEHLTPALQRALVRATAAARVDGISLRVTSGWRSAAKQQRLYDQAVAKYGSAERARQWVLPPGESEHVRGRAVDVGPHEAATWLEANGVRFGLCRRYANEPWHFELLAPHRGQSCPAMEPHA